MQRVATEAVRDILDPDLWLNTALAAAQSAIGLGRHAVITDCRFDNEAKAIKDAGGIMVQIVRPEVQAYFSDQHVSEAGIDPSLIDHCVVNDSTIETLDIAIDQLMDGVLAPV